MFNVKPFLISHCIKTLAAIESLMITALNKKLQIIRDALLIIFSIVVMSTSYGKWSTEPMHYVLFGMAAGMFSLTLMNVLLILIKTQKKRFFYFNTAVLAALLLALIWVLGFAIAILLILNIAVLFTLKEERTE